MSIALVSSTRRMIEASSRKPEALSLMRWLHEQRYRDYVIDYHLRRFLFLETALNHAETPDGRFTTQSLETIFRTGRRGSVRRALYAAARRIYVRFLRSEGRLIEPPLPWFAPIGAAYDEYLSEVRGLSVSARYHHGLTLRMLLEGLANEAALKALDRDDVERFVERRGRTLSRHSMQHTVAHVRSFMRYAHDAGLLSKRLDALDRPRTYRDELPPRAMPWAQVLKLLSSIDTKSWCGLRDLTLLHLIAHYGLRPSEAIGLKFDSIDWERSHLKVHQTKTHATLTLPLHAQTVRLLRRYLREDRLRCEVGSQRLFLRARCPHGPLTSHAVGDLFRKRMREAQLPDHIKQVYRLRHSLAMRLLARGVNIKAIGDVLGHRSFYGTSAYLRLDMTMLRDVALEVPTAGGAHA